MLTREVKCTIEGFEQVSVVYNLLGTPKQITELQMSVGDKDPGGVIVEVKGIENPFGENTPMALQMWIVHTGLSQAFAAFVRDPNSSTGSRPGTTGTSTGG